MDDFPRYQQHFREITHCYREANKPADYLANWGAYAGHDSIFDCQGELPAVARGEINLERLGYPNLRRRFV